MKCVSVSKLFFLTISMTYSTIFAIYHNLPKWILWKNDIVTEYVMNIVRKMIVYWDTSYPTIKQTLYNVRNKTKKLLDMN